MVCQKEHKYKKNSAEILHPEMTKSSFYIKERPMDRWMSVRNEKDQTKTIRLKPEGKTPFNLTIRVEKPSQKISFLFKDYKESIPISKSLQRTEIQPPYEDLKFLLKYYYHDENVFFDLEVITPNLIL